MALTVSAIQSNYLPWRGYFDIVAHSDLFIVYDEVAYSKNTWRNRNQILTANGKMWLTVPVAHAPLGTPINRIAIASDAWQRKHRRALEMSYGSLPGYKELGPVLEQLNGLPQRGLSALNTRLLHVVCGILDIHTPFVSAEYYGPLQEVGLARLLKTLHKAGATRYITGPAGLNYFTRSDFDQAGIELVVWDYSRYRPYPQRYGWDGFVSIVDLIANCGKDSAKCFSMKS